MITSGEGKHKIWLERFEIGQDTVYILGGGEKPHIGGAVICEPGKNPQTISLKNHHDYEVLELVAKSACKKFKKTVVAVGGIHIDNASKKDIEIILKNCKELVSCI
ncbi:MAG: hypothetical protein JXA91_00345 [Candidatus Thermoplasmatota archaeon]|nr:hypothetical protein [Candidatus Thermoplasmatota archaeon]